MARYSSSALFAFDGIYASSSTNCTRRFNKVSTGGALILDALLVGAVHESAVQRLHIKLRSCLFLHCIL